MCLARAMQQHLHEPSQPAAKEAARAGCIAFVAFSCPEETAFTLGRLAGGLSLTDGSSQARVRQLNHIEHN